MELFTFLYVSTLELIGTYSLYTKLTDVCDDEHGVYTHTHTQNNTNKQTNKQTNNNNSVVLVRKRTKMNRFYNVSLCDS
jgi:hypothetical protein